MNKRVLILSGPTHEYIDPVRFIGNSSSGRMGKAIAEEAVTRNYTVEFITGPVDSRNLPNLGKNGTIHSVTSADEMLEKATEFFKTSNIAIFAAAVADYTPAEKLDQKIAKSSDDLILRLRPTPDIAKTLCANKRPSQIAIGFALQTDNGKVNALRKQETKNLDGIILNTPATLGAATGSFSFLAAGSEEFTDWGCIDKTICAINIFQRIESTDSA